MIKTATTCLPNINSSILLWGHQAHQIFKLHKKAIRIISLSKYDAHSASMMHTVPI